ncbi:fimbria/pilus outer membrane usher protein [Aeromonas salmonicida]|uniref:fimbria/pilus outer membrane usher protein n=1 Tax=Aeromonas salmonicida TaxID=645 RepID=UPI0022408006|nr:fimbria/pilus outer membrane usher protein [Aeromonas salmonicida]
MNSCRYHLNYSVKFLGRVFFLAVVSMPGFANNSDYIFDESLLLGGGYNVGNLAKISESTDVLPGEYLVDVFFNGDFLSRENIYFYKTESESSVQPCLDKKFWSRAKVSNDYINVGSVDVCKDGALVDGSYVEFDASKLRMEVTVPQAYLLNLPRGYISPDLWEPGDSAVFTNYYSNYYRSESHQENNNMTASSYLGFNSGVNFGLWRLRNQSTYQHYRSNNYKSSKFDSIRTYLTRAVPSLEAELEVGELYTRSSVFGSLGFNGVQLQTDTRMLPNSQRGYAPIITGIAKTTAKVIIKQDGNQIYQTTVAAGPFEIRDLYPTSYQGDLAVEIIEADGRVSSFVVPFSAVPGSIRPGKSTFSLSMGKTRDTGLDDYFTDIIYERGLSNLVTLNSGVRLADDYISLSAGSVLGTELGAFGSTLVYSKTNLDEDDTDVSSTSGWRFGLSYSRSFASGTSVTLAGYKYSTEGYRELSDILRQKEYILSGYQYSSGSYLQKTEMNLSINQSMGEWGTLSLSGSKRQYRDNRVDDDQYQLGYSNSIGPVSLGVNYSRQYLGLLPGNIVGESINHQHERIKDDVWAVTLSMPLGTKSMVSSGFSHGGNTDSYNIGLSGTLDENNTLSYNVSANRQNNESQAADSFSMGVDKRTHLASFGGIYSHAEKYDQFSANIRGAAVLHSGGLTLGQAVGDTFAIIEAKGAEGAELRNNWGSYVDSNGYALVSSLTPYIDNDITLGAGYMSEDIELLDTQQKVVPYAGAIIKVNFETRSGKAVIFVSKVPSGEVVPLGAEISGHQGDNLGVVGQAGLAYVRVPDTTGTITMKWGDKVEEQCHFDYHLGDELKNALPRITVTCVP